MEPLICAPLRAAAIYAIDLDAGAVPIATMAIIAQVAEDRARAFASILVAQRACILSPAGLVRGPEWEAWRGRPTRTRPHQTSDRQALATMDRMRAACALRVRAALNQRGWSINQLARQAGVHTAYVHRLVRRHVPPPACQLALVARALGTTVDALLADLPS